MKLKWKNKFSGEEGYVKQVNVSKGHFTNTFVYDDAKKYMTIKALEADVKKLRQMGEGDNNDFFAVQ